VTTVSDAFVPSATPNGYDANGAQTPDFVPSNPDFREFEIESVDREARTLTAKQVYPVPGETEGYKAPGGTVRPSMRDRIAAKRPYSVEKIYVKSWDEWVEVRSISLGVRNDMMERVMDPETKEANVKLLIPELLIQTAYDPETGTRVFADDDLAFLNGQDSNAADEVAAVAMRLSGMVEGDKDKEAGKSSETETSVSAS
jgi:hypothetical protein